MTKYLRCLTSDNETFIEGKVYESHDVIWNGTNFIYKVKTEKGFIIGVPLEGGYWTFQEVPDYMYTRQFCGNPPDKTQETQYVFISEECGAFAGTLEKIVADCQQLDVNILEGDWYELGKACEVQVSVSAVE